MWVECIVVVSGCCCKEVYRFRHNITYPYSICISSFFSSIIPTSLFINPRRACAEGYSSRLVCMYVCHVHAILAVRAIKIVTKDTIVLNVRFAAIL